MRSTAVNANARSERQSVLRLASFLRGAGCRAAIFPVFGSQPGDEATTRSRNTRSYAFLFPTGCCPSLLDSSFKPFQLRSPLLSHCCTEATMPPSQRLHCSTSSGPGGCSRSDRQNHHIFFTLCRLSLKDTHISVLTCICNPLTSITFFFLFEARKTCLQGLCTSRRQQRAGSTGL